MNILITGTDGFIGSNLKEHLKTRGNRIFGTVFIKAPETNEIRLDLTRDEDFPRLPKITFDVIIHAAGSIDQGLGSDRLMKINAAGTRRVVNWAKENGCRHLIHLSSVSVYGLKTLGQDRKEDNTKRYEGIFALPYMRSKSLAEKYVEQSGLPCTILRLPPVMGGNDSYFSKAIAAPLKNDRFCFSGKGDKLVSILFIKNLGDIVEKIIGIGPLKDIFNCADHHVRWDEIVAEYSKGLGIEIPHKRCSIVSVIPHFKDKKHLLMVTFSYFGAHYPSDKLFSRIGYSPRLSWQSGVKEAVASHS